MTASLYSEINMLTIIILMIIALTATAFGYEKTMKLKAFVTSVWFAAGANLFDFIWNMGLTGVWNLSAPIMMCVNFSYFISFGMSSLFWYLYSENIGKDSVPKNKYRILGMAVPLILLALLLICSAYTGCVFHFDENMQYHRGKFYYFQHILSYGYIVAASAKMLILSSKKKYIAYKEDFLLTASFVIPPIICGILQIILQQIPILSVGIVISFLLAYINSLNTLISADQLTGLNNRRTLFSYISSKAENMRPNEKLYFLFIDVDSFKQINDTYGHNEGDRALKIIAEVLSSLSEKTGGFCARYAGDEFAFIQISSENEDIKKLCEEIKANVAEKNEKSDMAYSLNVSIGYSSLKSGDKDWQDLIYRADKEMYYEKRKKEYNS